MIKFKDEQGNITTPRIGDYVLASDIANEEQHNAVREEFGAAGCKIEEYGEFGDNRCEPHEKDWDAITWHYQHIVWAYSSDEFDCKRRIIPIYQRQTLFEAAKDADDGTRFKLNADSINGYGEAVFVKTPGTLRREHDNSPVTCLDFLARTDFEQLPPEPVKSDTIPQHLLADYNKVQVLVANLLKWPGAQVGLATKANNKTVYVPVYYETKDQFDAAMKAECPHAPNIDMVNVK